METTESRSVVCIKKVSIALALNCYDGQDANGLGYGHATNRLGHGLNTGSTDSDTATDNAPGGESTELRLRDTTSVFS